MSRNGGSANVAPRLDFSTVTVVNIDEGKSLAFSGTFTDPGNDGWTVTVDFGDGTEPAIQRIAPGAARAFDIPAHTFDDNGIYLVTVAVRDDQMAKTALWVGWCRPATWRPRQRPWPPLPAFLRDRGEV